MRFLKSIVLIFLLLILSIEVGLRIFSYKKLRRFDHVDYIYNSELGYSYKPNSQGYVTTAAFKNKYKINSLGYNWDEFSKSKKSGVYRIILISHSDGTGLYTDGPNNYVKLLQQKFIENGDKIEILNFSIDGEGTANMHLRIAEKSIQYQPDLILLNAQIPITISNLKRLTYKGYQIRYFNNEKNDIIEAMKYIDGILINPPWFSRLYDISYIFRYLCRIYIETKNKSLKNRINKILKYKGPFIEFHRKRIVFIKPIIDTKNHEEFKKKLQNVEHKNKETVKEQEKILWAKYKLEKKALRDRLLENKKTIKLSLSQSIREYLKTKNKLEDEGVKLVLFNTYKNENKRLKLDSLGLNYLNINVDYKSEYSFGNVDGHTNQLGHKIIAEKFYKKIYTEKIVPIKYFGIFSITPNK